MLSASGLLTLSPELLVQIISYLSFKDIISCEASCRHLHGVVRSSVLLKYLKEAGRTGVYDPLDAGFTFPERLERLRLWQKNWENLDIPDTSARITFDLDIWSPLIGSLHNGHLIVTDADPAVYASSDISSLPGARPIRSIELGNLTLVTEGLLHVFAFADEYDLVAIVSTGKIAEGLPYDIYSQPSAIVLTVRLLTLSESTAHPLAETPQFDIFLKSRFLLWCTLDAQVAGDSLVILTCHDRSCEFDEIHLVYWKEGTTHCLRRSPPSTYFPQVAFLSEDTLVLVQKEGNALELCQITRKDPPGLDTLCVLVLPALQQGISCVMVECQGDQIVASRDLLMRTRRLPFISDPNATVLCFTLGFRQVVGGFDYLRSVSFWVRRSSLCEYANRGGNREHPWDTWGPSVTRWTDWEHGLAPCRPGGSRSALFPLLIEVGTGNPIVIRDFHPERVRRALARDKGPSLDGDRLKVVTESSKIEKGDEFLNDIVSSLPYCEATSEKRYGYHEILIDDERIVGITRGDEKGTIDIHLMI
ncbi:hypothetical protein DFH94DRAFT_126431 [Russula ochroleuca]|uniref:F-box domain-containing protein n=1 Tax=Russula ochroleuca TaxID=152965 RepID=A0A9P5JZU5_9AGAM|nr:hypothetical protein DFH94DRAFT_126431 [Russula ochroleuca]